MNTNASRAVAAWALAAVALGGLVAAPQAHAAGTGATTASVSLRTGSSTAANRLVVIPKGTAVTVQCQVKGQLVRGVTTSEYWAKVTYAGKTGYVSRAYVRVVNASGIGPCASAPKATPTTRPSTSQPAPKPTAAQPTSGSQIGGTISRSEVITRAKFWVNKHLPYSQAKNSKDAQGKSYRTDCSGLVSMALHLNTSYTTQSLRQVVTPISKESLKPGDLIGNLGRGDNEAGHVVIFNGWANDAHTRFYTLEETTDSAGGAQALTRSWGTSYWNKQGWRYTKITG